jgi:hypothetical protein
VWGDDYKCRGLLDAVVGSTVSDTAEAVGGAGVGEAKDGGGRRKQHRKLGECGPPKWRKKAGCGK